MRLDITGRHVDIGNSLRQLIQKRLGKLESLLNDNAVSGKVILTKEKYRHRTEVIIHARGDHMLRGMGEGNAWPISIRQAVEKIEQQAQKLKGKWGERKRRATPRRVVAARADGAVVVTRAGKTSQAQVKAALANLRAVEARVLGCVLNMRRVKGGVDYQYYSYTAGPKRRRGKGRRSTGRAALPAPAMPPAQTDVTAPR